MVHRIKFKGEEYLLINDYDDDGGVLCGAIATPTAYSLGEVSYAHLFPSGEVMRFEKVIGSVADVEVIERDVHPEVGKDAMFNTLFGEWPTSPPEEGS